MSVKQDLNRLRRQYRQAGWTIETGGKHLLWYPPGSNHFAVTTSITPASNRALRNIEADLKRATRKALAVFNRRG